MRFQNSPALGQGQKLQFLGNRKKKIPVSTIGGHLTRAMEKRILGEKNPTLLISIFSPFFCSLPSPKLIFNIRIFILAEKHLVIVRGEHPGNLYFLFISQVSRDWSPDNHIVLQHTQDTPFIQPTLNTYLFFD